MANKELTYKDVWDNLSKIDCSDKVEKKMNLSYLSWAWAWGVLMEHYPQASYLFYQGEDDVPYVKFPDGTAEVRCRVSIDNLTREMTLSVMDNRNNVEEVKKPVKKEEPKDDKGEEWAELFVKSFLDLAKLQKTKEGMTSYYKSNTADLTTLREKFPEKKEMLDGELKSIVSNLKEV